MRLEKESTTISWEEYFMQLAILTAKRSKDPDTKVGACIVNSEKKVIGLGYNGFVNISNNDNLFPWDKHSINKNKTKYAYVVHAEANAILNATTSVKDCTIFVTHFPCNECTKLVIQSGIKRVVYLKDKLDIASEKMLSEANIAVVKYRGGISVDDTSLQVNPVLNNKLTYATIIRFLKMVEKAAYFCKTPEKGYKWEAKYEKDKILLSYTNGTESNGVYLDIVHNKCVNHDSNHNMNLCKIAESVLNIIMSNYEI